VGTPSKSGFDLFPPWDEHPPDVFAHIFPFFSFHALHCLEPISLEILTERSKKGFLDPFHEQFKVVFLSSFRRLQKLVSCVSLQTVLGLGSLLCL